MRVDGIDSSPRTGKCILSGVSARKAVLILRAGRRSRKQELTLARAARPQGNGVIRKRGETFGVSPLVRPPRAAANISSNAISRKVVAK